VKKPVALLLALAAFGLAGSGTATAQVYYYGPGYYGQRYFLPGMAPWRVARIVRAAGLTPLSAPTRRGPTYEVVALDPDGRHVRVMVDAYQGAITSVRPVAALRPNGEPYAAPPPHMTGAPSSEEAEAALGARPGPIAPTPYGSVRPPQPLPPQALPPQGTSPTQATQPLPNPPPSNQRLANAPAITGSTAPTENLRTPIPRPRPSAAATAAVTPSQTPAATPSTAAPAPTDVPEAPPAPTRARPAAPTAAAAPPAASAKTAASSAPAAKSETARPATTLVPVAPLE
jgi:hypothetical protein